MDRYIALFDPCEEGGFTVTFPDLPGAISQGEDFADAVAMAAECLALHLRGLREDRDPIPTPRRLEDLPAAEIGEALPHLVMAKWLPDLKKRYNISMDAGLMDAITREAKASGSSASAFIAEAAREKLGL